MAQQSQPPLQGVLSRLRSGVDDLVRAGRHALGARPRGGRPRGGRAHGADAQTTVQHWYGPAQLRRGQHQGLTASGTGLRLADAGQPGRWTSPVVHRERGFAEAIVSWNVRTPGASWTRIQVRALRKDQTWTDWFVVANWGADLEFTDDQGQSVRRSSVPDQNGPDGSMQTDTLVAGADASWTGYQVRVRLFGQLGALPSLSGVSVMTSSELAPYEPAPYQPLTPTTEAGTDGDPRPNRSRVELDVPTLAQHLHDGEYPEFGGGGQVWCSPTSVSMVLSYWGAQHLPTATELDQVEAPHGDPIVPFAARATWDAAYAGCGNWVFNTAFAHQYGVRAFVTRLAGLDEAEAFLRAGIPLVASVAFEKDQMPEAGYRTDGHLLVIVGITEDGDVIVNDPARKRNDQVRSTYRRANFERAWQGSCHGIVYVLHPAAIALPDVTALPDAIALPEGAGLRRSW